MDGDRERPRFVPMLIPHNFPFDPTYGYTLEQLLAVRAPNIPKDFAAFWQDTYSQARAIALRLKRRKIASPDERFKVYEVEYDSLNGVRIGAWIVVPANKQPRAGVVVGHGYGGRGEPEFALPYPDVAAIFPCARGFNRSAHPDISNNSHIHVMQGLESRENYMHRGCVVDFWLAASVLLELYPKTAGHLFYHGGSFGGGIGALLLPWDLRFHGAFLDIPSFGNHPLRVKLTCVGSGQAIQNYYHNGHTHILKVLQYFDAAVAARFIKIPVFVAAATFDPAVPPPGQFCVYNSLVGPKELYLRQAAHFELAGNEHDAAAINARLKRWHGMKI